VESPRRNAEILLSELLGIRAHEIYLAREMVMDGGTLGKYLDMIERRASGEPLAYVVGNADFMGIVLSVQKGVFIPRPETELLCEIALEHLAMVKSPLAADICTGCGAIALALTSFHPDASCFGTDVSEKAIACARENARMLGLSDRTRFLEGHLTDPLESLDLEGKLDCVVANPPYVRDGDLGQLPVEIAEHEPLAALRGGVEGTLLYPRLIEGAAALLKRGGLIVLEVGDSSADDVSALISELGFTGVRVRDDLRSLPRFITGLRG